MKRLWLGSLIILWTYAAVPPYGKRQYRVWKQDRVAYGKDWKLAKLGCLFCLTYHFRVFDHKIGSEE